MIEIANRIALQFAALPREQAIEAVRDHIEKFWERPMKDRLIYCVARGGDGLHELVIEAVRRMELNA